MGLCFEMPRLPVTESIPASKHSLVLILNRGSYVKMSTCEHGNLRSDSGRHWGWGPRPVFIWNIGEHKYV